MFRRHAFVVFASISALALSGVLAGCAEDTVATPRVTLNTDIDPGSNGEKCQDTTPRWLTIGSFGDPSKGQNPDGSLVAPVAPVDDGATDPFIGGFAAVTCSVAPAQDGFNVAATASLSGTNGGSVRVVGFFKPGQDNTVEISVTKNSTTYVQRDCLATFAANTLQGVASGRVWATATCGKAEAADKQRVCQTVTQFRFENCGQ